MNTAIVTGASAGFGFALATALVERGDTVVIDGRDEQRLIDAAQHIEAAGPGQVVALAGDVTDARHRSTLLEAAARAGSLSLLVHNASELGPSPLPSLAGHPVDVLERVLAVNIVAPVALTQLALPLLRSVGGTVVMVSSDAAVEAYAGWGGYGASKAALDHIARVLAVEEPDLRIYAFDPGDMRTAMHQRAFPGEDISDRAEPQTVVPALLRLVDTQPASGRYRAADLLAGQPA